ncbi:AMP-binding protein [Phaeacidiphilus oryzae]|uniref:AMP-binding protein n=1 Tax=Phaeacidiphilus oryzae TaxID=348818 RepID=UPI0005652077|nr:AMP-binding protein [Phaeacidiphilus oryzae]
MGREQSQGDVVAEYLADLGRRQARARSAAGQPGALRPRSGARTLPAAVAHWARTAPERTALVFAGREWSYARLDEAVDRLAGWMAAEAGVRPGDRVAVFLGNRPEFVIAMLAALRIGAVHVPVNPMFRAAELRHELTDAEPVLAVTDPVLRELLEEVRPEAPSVRRVLDADGEEWARAVSGHARHGACADDPDALAALNYTGGTTGLPKGCEHTGGDMMYTAAAIDLGITGGTGEPAVYVCFLPVFWIAGENLGILAPLASGGTCVLLPRWDARAVLNAISAHRVRVLTGTVENYLELLERVTEEDDLSSLTHPATVSFVRKLTPEIRRRWRDAAGPHSVLREASYGMTETHTSDTATTGFQDGDRDLTTDPVFCGLPVPGTELMVADFATDRPLPLGERGQILIRTPSLLHGYWRRPEATAAAVTAEGWLRTGDIGLLDEDGCLHYLGRDKDMIKVKGMSVFPTEVETLLAAHPEVLAAAVVPVEDAERGQRPYAFVRTVPGSELTAEQLTSWARESMAGYKVPQIELTAGLPLTATGKIRKTVLVERAAKAVAGGAARKV